MIKPSARSLLTGNGMTARRIALTLIFGGLLAASVACGTSSSDAPVTCACGFIEGPVLVVATSCDPSTFVHDYTLSGPCELLDGAIAPTGGGTCTVTLPDGASASATFAQSDSGCCGTYIFLTTALPSAPDAGTVGRTENMPPVDVSELVIPESGCGG